LLFDLDLPDSFDMAVEMLFQNRRLGVALGTNARTYVDKKFSWENVAAAYLDLLQIL
jgi:glycosyltransferase involved in cell wall biosynthesis